MPARELARHLHADHVGLWEERRLTEHRRLGFDPAHAPSEDPEPVDHRGVGIGAHQRVGEGHAVPDAHDLTEMLQVHLVADAGAGRDDAEPVERLLGPSEQRVALTVAPVLPFDVRLVGVLGAEEVHLDRVIDDQVDRHERIDGGRIPARSGDRAPHRGQIDDRRDPREVLHQDPARHERHVRRRFGPPCERAHVLVRDVPRTGPTEEVLDEDADRQREAADVGDARLREPGKRVDVEGSVGGLQPLAGAGEFRSHPMGPLVVVSVLRSDHPPTQTEEPRREAVARMRRQTPSGASFAARAVSIASLCAIRRSRRSFASCWRRRCVVRLGEQRPDRSRTAGRVHGDEDEVRAVHVPDRPGERVLRLDPNPAFHRGPADVVHACFEDDHLADLDGLEERHLVDRDGEGHAPGVLDRGQSRRPCPRGA